MTKRPDDESDLDRLIADAVGEVSAARFDSMLDAVARSTSNPEHRGGEPETVSNRVLVAFPTKLSGTRFTPLRIMGIAAAALLLVGIGIGVGVGLTRSGSRAPLETALPSSRGSSTTTRPSTVNPNAAADTFSFELPHPGGATIGALPPGVSNPTNSTAPDAGFFVDLDILANDSGVFDRIEIVSPPSYGTVSWQAVAVPDPPDSSSGAMLGRARYRPTHLDEAIHDSFTYRLVNSSTNAVTAPVPVSVSLAPG